jgi:hypothetical protein
MWEEVVFESVLKFGLRMVKESRRMRWEGHVACT